MKFQVDEIIAGFLAQELDEDSTEELLQWVSASAANKLYFQQPGISSFLELLVIRQRIGGSG